MKPTIRQRVRWWLNARRHRELVPPNMSELPWARYAMDEQTGEVFDARTFGRWAARRRFKANMPSGYGGRLRVERRFARYMTKQEIWAACDREDEWRARMEDELDAALTEDVKVYPPELAPEYWEPDEYDPAWEFCDGDAPGAAPVWFVEYPC